MAMQFGARTSSRANSLLHVSEEQVVRQLLSQRTRLLAYLCAIVGNASMAEDLYQEVSLEAIRQRQELRDPAALPTWLRRTARNKALAMLKSRRREQDRLSDVVLDHIDRLWDEDFDHRQELYLDALRNCLGRLAPRSQQIIKMRYAENRRGVEVAKKLGIGRKSLYVAMSRIHVQLRGCVEKTLSREGSHG